MIVAISGAGGLIGSEVAKAISASGGSVLRLVRRPPRGEDELQWDPAQGVAAAEWLSACDAVVHLAGAGLADRRWTPARKRELRDSRVPATMNLCRSLASLSTPPRVLVMASAMGIYGDRGDERLDESSPIGRGFLAEMARDWEGAADPARERGIRVVMLRFGLVLSPRGGVLAKMLTPFRLGLGGPLGHAHAWWSWVAIDDIVGLVRHAIATPALAGPVNATAPHAVTSGEFARALGRALGRPALFPVPAFVLRLVLGEMADAAVLTSLRVEPGRAIESGYRFLYEDLGPALAHLLPRGG